MPGRPIPVVPRPNLQRLAPRSVEATTSGIVIGSVLGGTALLLVCLFLVLFPLWHRRCRGEHAQKDHSTRNPTATTPPERASPTPNTPLPHRPFGGPTVRPVTPSPCRLFTDAGAASSSSSRRWRLEKAAACVHTPSGHPAFTTATTTNNNSNSNSNNNNNDNTNDNTNGAITTPASNSVMYRGDMLDNTITNSTSGSGGSNREGQLGDLLLLQHDSGSNKNDDHNNSNGSGNGRSSSSSRNRNSNIPPRDSLAASVSSAFAAEMSSLLESISLKSSYSSLRSGGLGVPPRVAQAWRPQGAGGGVRAMEGDGDGACAGDGNDDTRTVPAAPCVPLPE